MLSVIWVCGVGASLLGAPPAERKLDRYEFIQVQMGVQFTITLYAPDEQSANAASRAAYARIKQLNAILSDYDPDSELSRLCTTAGKGQAVPVSPELFFMFARSQALARDSDGAFDATVGPVIALWRKARRRKALPDKDELAAAIDLVGWRAIQLDEKSRTAKLLKPGMRLDLGGIAKGYAGDEALRVLKEHHITRALVAASGDIVAGDPPPGKSGWRIGLAPLAARDAPPSRFIEIQNAAVSTSGDLFQFVEIGGTRYSHIVDPRTGLGLTHSSSVSVIARDGTTADSVATALSVLGPERGMKLLDTITKQNNTSSPRTAVRGIFPAALFVIEEQGEKKTYESPTFKQFAPSE